MKKFALTGAAGFIAPRHLRAIHETGNDLIAALDPFDSVGVLDSYFPKADFFTEFERFDRHLERLKRNKQGCDFLTICAPNYLHDAHIRLGLRLGCDVICEKPLVLNPWNVHPLEELEEETGKKVYNVLQLRLHPSIIELKNKIEKDTSGKIYDIDLAYITSRGRWYHHSWKGDTEKSGGIATNIGVHFFDMLSWIFGKPLSSEVHVLNESIAAGYLELDRARVRWFLSIDEETIPSNLREQGIRTYRSLKIEDEEFEFSKGFTDLHTLMYMDILNGKGFRLGEAHTSIEMVHHIRTSKPRGPVGECHPLLKEELAIDEEKFIKTDERGNRIFF
jgi:UDP-N-acetyl-2-amino-2-deoxyglucuronate dehydrogenase